MGVMTLHAFSLHRIFPMTFQKSRLIAPMTGKAETVRLLCQQEILIRPVIHMTAAAALFNRGMHIGPGKLFSVMTGKTEIRTGGFQQPRMGAVMHLMARHTAAVGHRPVHGLFLAFLGLLSMAGKTLLRRILPQIHAADHAVMQVTGLAFILLHRFMHHPLFISGSNIGMAFNAAFSGLAYRLAGNAGHQQTQSESKSEQKLNFLSRHEDHRAPFLFSPMRGRLLK